MPVYQTWVAIRSDAERMDVVLDGFLEVGHFPQPPVSVVI
jgi:hypothetical protein